jgi:hypothetical protein
MVCETLNVDPAHLLKYIDCNGTRLKGLEYNEGVMQILSDDVVVRAQIEMVPQIVHNALRSTTRVAPVGPRFITFCGGGSICLCAVGKDRRPCFATAITQIRGVARN